MTLTKEILFVTLFALFISSPANTGHSPVPHTQTRYMIKDELASKYIRWDLKDMMRRLHDTMRNLKENASKKFNNLLPMQGKSKTIVADTKEQARKLKAQQQVRNQVQKDRLRDLQQKNQALAQQRADLKQKIRFDR